MRKPNNKHTRLSADLKALKIGDTISHYVDLEIRQAAYDEARRMGIGLCIQRVPTKPGKFEITRIR